MAIAFRLSICALIAWFVFSDALNWKRTIEAYEAKFTPPPAASGGDRPVFLDDDPYCWVVNAEDMVRQHTWRVRHTQIDNAPFGRDMHYSQSVTWMMILTGEIRAFVTGDSLLKSIAPAAVWVNPLLLTLFLGGLFWLISSFLGAVPALLTVIWMAAHGDVWWAFHPYRPDHQTFHLIFSLLPIVLLTIGGWGWTSPASRQIPTLSWFRFPEPPSEKSARRWFLAAGVAEALDLWVGAIVQSAFLGLMVFGVAAFFLILRPNRSEGRRSFEPRLFRWWSVGGAAVSLLMYGVEYLPGRFPLRLEVNHPLYALFWVAAGECLILLLTLCCDRRRPTWSEWGWGLSWLALGLILPLVFAFGGTSVHVLRDGEYNRLLSVIIEFQHFWDSSKGSMLADFASFHSLLPLFLVAGGWMLWKSNFGVLEKQAIWIAELFALALLLLAFNQQRWFCFYAQFNIWLMVLCLAIWGRKVTKSVGREIFLMGATASLFLAPLWLFREQSHKLRVLREGDQMVEQIVHPILIKRFVLALGQLLGGKDVRIMADPGLAAPLYYFAKLPTVGSFYWEDINGLHDTLDFFNATDDVQALKIARARGITHVILPHTGGEANEFYYFKTGKRSQQPFPNLAYRLTNGTADAPLWISKSYDLISLELLEWRFGPVMARNNIDVWEVTDGR